MAKSIAADLDALVAKARATKTAALKQAEGPVSGALDKAEDGTKPAATGEQAAKMEKEVGDANVASPDSGAKTNPVGGSVDKNTDGSTAPATNGSAGGKGADMEPKKDAANGPTDKGTPEGNGGSSGAFKSAAELRKQADALDSLAESCLTSMDKFLVKAARTIDNVEMKKTAEAMPDDQLAGAASDNLMEQIQSGQLGEDEAAQILEEMLQSGAISEDDIAQGVQMLQGQGGAAGADQGAPDAAAGAGADAAAPMDGGAPEQKVAAEMAEMAKLASIGPEHPEYLKKLAMVYPEEFQVGYQYALQLADELVKEAEESKAYEGKETPAEEKKEKKKEDKKEEASDGDKDAAVKAVNAELGIPDDAAKALAAQPLPPMDKVAAFKHQYKTELLSRLAAIQG